MLNFNVRIEKPRIDDKYCQSQLERATKALARIISTEASKEIPQKFNLKRQWIARGMRYELTGSSPNSAEAEVFHKDILMRNHQGMDLHGHLATPTEFARARFNDRVRRPRYLLKLNGVYIDPRGGDIFQRDRHTTRKIFFFSKTHHYRERINLREIAMRPKPMDLD